MTNRQIGHGVLEHKDSQDWYQTAMYAIEGNAPVRTTYEHTGRTLFSSPPLALKSFSNPSYFDHRPIFFYLSIILAP